MVSKAQRQAAVEYARQELPRLLHAATNLKNSFSAHDQKVADNLRRLEDCASLGPSLPEDSPYHVYLRLLIEDASRDPAAFEVLALLAARAIDAGEPMAKELRKFAVDVLREQIQSPIARGAPPIHSARNTLIHALLLDIVDRFEVTPTRNKGASSGDSACDIVAETMPRKARLPKSYSQIEAIWLQGERTDREEEADPAD